MYFCAVFSYSNLILILVKEDVFRQDNIYSRQFEEWNDNDVADF